MYVITKSINSKIITVAHGMCDIWQTKSTENLVWYLYSYNAEYNVMH